MNTQKTGSIISRIPYGAVDYKAELTLRNKILRIPLGLDRWDEALSGETNDAHLGAFDGDILVGVLVLTRVNSESVRMRQVAVDENCQRRGIGTALVAAAEREAISLGYIRMTLHARQTAVAFYERLGYTVEGEPFAEVGIPHRAMSKALKLV